MDGSPGRQLAMLTLTQRHTAGDRLADEWNALSPAWQSVIGTKLWKAEKTEHGVIGFLKVVEVTHGQHGWHPHIHVLLFIDSGTRSPVTADDLARWRSRIIARWSRSLVRHGRSPVLDRAQDFKLITDPDAAFAAYFAKQTDRPLADAVAHEFSQSASKNSRSASGGRTPWEILDGAIAAVPRDRQLWHEFEHASRGRRQMAWSKGLRDHLGLGEDLTDEEILEAENPSVSNPLCQVRRASREMCADTVNSALDRRADHIGQRLRLHLLAVDDKRACGVIEDVEGPKVLLHGDVKAVEELVLKSP